jgi:carboxyl-terminal processing protease
MLRYVLIFLLLFSFGLALAQEISPVKGEAMTLKSLILKHHFGPKKVNDEFSQIVFEELLNALDPDRIYFTQLEITELSVYKHKIDDDLTGLTWGFLPAVTQRYKQSLLRSDGIIEQHTTSAFDFSKSDIFISDTTYATDDRANAIRWYKHIKYDALNELIRLRKKNPQLAEKEFLLKNEAEARQRARRSNKRMIHRILYHSIGYEAHVANQFLQAISFAFDPHSSYLSSAQMENFLSSVSTDGYYFGISVDENELGEITITQLTPGGPAWKSGEVHAGDIIEQIRWEGSEWIEVDGMTRSEFDNLLQESVKSSIEFVLRQTGGLEKTVRLRKEKMSADENRVKSFILEGQQKIGYISLPGFYTDWGDVEGTRCANDVATEILKLKKENIDGLVVDVRYNGGGSLREAVAMAGIFIDAGPMGVLKEGSGNIIPEKDMNRGTVYDGPLLVLVNGQSASASEFLAAALQDYRRAIVVGSRTYGKATGQNIFPLNADKNKSTLKWGFTTITTLKIYRVTGKTAQQYGVIPDIILPDLYDSIDFREESLRGVLPSDSISKRIYYTPLSLLPLCELKERSERRVRANEGFQTTSVCSKSLKYLRHKFESVSLNWSEYKKLMDHEAAPFEKLKSITDKPTAVFKVNHHASDNLRMKQDEYLRHVNEVWAKKLMRDISLEEAFYIICDYIKGPDSK